MAYTAELEGVKFKSLSDDVVGNPVRLSEAMECGVASLHKSECRRYDVVKQLILVKLIHNIVAPRLILIWTFFRAFPLVIPG